MRFVNTYLITFLVVHITVVRHCSSLFLVINQISNSNPVTRVLYFLASSQFNKLSERGAIVEHGERAYAPLTQADPTRLVHVPAAPPV